MDKLCVTQDGLLFSNKMSFFENKCMDTNRGNRDAMNCEIRIDVNTLPSVEQIAHSIGAQPGAL